MTHNELSDLFADTYTVIKKDAIKNDKINITTVGSVEVIEFEFENNHITLNREVENLSIYCNNDIIFNIPILEEPNKTIEISQKSLEFLKRLNNFNFSLKSSLNIKSYLTDKSTLDNAITINKRKFN